MLYACVWVLPASWHYFIEHSLYLLRFNLDCRFIFFPMPLEIPQWQTENTETHTQHKQGQCCQGLSQHVPLKTSGLNFKSNTTKPNIALARGPHSHSQRLNSGWFCVTGCVLTCGKRSNRLAVLQSRGELWETVHCVCFRQLVPPPLLSH